MEAAVEVGVGAAGWEAVANVVGEVVGWVGEVVASARLHYYYDFLGETYAGNCFVTPVHGFHHGYSHAERAVGTMMADIAVAVAVADDTGSGYIQHDYHPFVSSTLAP